MNTSPKYDLPWELITDSLAGTLTAEEKIQLQQWLSSDPAHKSQYLEIQELWINGMEDYKLYKEAKQKEAWKALHAKLKKPKHKEVNVIHEEFAPNRKLAKNLIAIAAMFIGLVGIGLWFILNKDNPMIYETAANVQKKVILSDGSTIIMQPMTRIEVAHDYNKTYRTVIMVSGEAYFDVKHRSDSPFIVELGTTQIKDIGTSFTIRKKEKEITVAVTSGKIAFVKLANKETRELTAGSGITFNVQNESFGEINLAVKADEQMLNFENTPLSDVIVAIRKVYGKRVIISDRTILNNKLTAKLGGMSYDASLKVICKSLGLEYSINDSVYILKQKN